MESGKFMYFSIATETDGTRILNVGTDGEEASKKPDIIMDYDEARSLAKYLFKVVGEDDTTLKEVLHVNGKTLRQLYDTVNQSYPMTYTTIQRYGSETKPGNTLCWKYIKRTLDKWGIDF